MEQQKTMVDTTIIIPLYNVESFLPSLFVCLAEQSYQGFRVIMVDDASSDRTYEIAHYLAEPFGDRVTLIKNENNIGQGSTRNVGLDKACEKPTKYITFLDADDWFESDYLNDLHAAAEGRCADLAISGIVRFDDKSGSVLCKEMTCFENIFFDDSSQCDDLATINTCPYAKLFRFEPIKTVRFRIADRSEDTCYLFESLPFLKRVVFTNNAFYHYRVRKDSLTGVIDEQTIESMHCLFDSVYHFFQSTTGMPYKELFEAQVYIRSSVGGVTRVALSDMKKTKRLSCDELKWLDTTMPSWRNNKYLSFGDWRSRTPKQLALKMSAMLYRHHAFPLFVFLYYFVSVIMNKEVRV